MTTTQSRPTDVTASGGGSGGWRAVLGYWLTVYSRMWKGTLITAFLAPVAFLAGMGIGLGSLVDAGGETAVPGVPYLAFVATGLLAAQAMQTAVSETTFPVLGAIKWRRTYYAMLATPLRVEDLVRGHVVYVTIRLLIGSTVFTAVSVMMGAIGGWGILGSLAFAVLGGLAFATPVYCYSARARSEQAYNVLVRFVIMPMFLFSGTFFPVTQLPAWLQVLAWVSPLSHAGSLTRAAALGPHTPFALAPSGYALHVGYLLVWAVVGYLLAVRELRRRMES